MWSRNRFYLRRELLGYAVEKKGIFRSVGMRRWGLNRRWARLVLDGRRNRPLLVRRVGQDGCKCGLLGLPGNGKMKEVSPDALGSKERIS